MNMQQLVEMLNRGGWSLSGYHDYEEDAWRKIAEGWSPIVISAASITQTDSATWLRLEAGSSLSIWFPLDALETAERAEGGDVCDVYRERADKSRLKVISFVRA